MTIVCGWTGEAFMPLNRDLPAIREILHPGDRVLIEVSFPQSYKKRGLFHAMIAEIYASLPEHLAKGFRNADHLRHHLTIRAGYAVENQTICMSKAEARRLASAISRDDRDSIIEVKDKIVTKWTAMSTSSHRMSGRTFSELVDKVLSLGSEMIGVAPEELRRHTERDAHV